MVGGVAVCVAEFFGDWRSPEVVVGEADVVEGGGFAVAVACGAREGEGLVVEGEGLFGVAEVVVDAADVVEGGGFTRAFTDGALEGRAWL